MVTPLFVAPVTGPNRIRKPVTVERTVWRTDRDARTRNRSIGTLYRDTFKDRR